MMDNKKNTDTGISLVTGTGLLGIKDSDQVWSAISPYRETSGVLIHVSANLWYVNAKNQTGSISFYKYSIAVPFNRASGFYELILRLFNLSIPWRGFVLTGGSQNEIRTSETRFIPADFVSEWQASKGLQADGILGHKSVAAIAAETGIPYTYLTGNRNNISTGTISTISATTEVRIDFGHFIRQACLNLYSSDDATIIGKLYDMRFKMGVMGSNSTGSIDSLDDIECIIEASKLIEAAYFELREDLAGSFMHIISQDEYLARIAANNPK